MKTLLLTLFLLIPTNLMAKTYVIQAEGMVCQACVETVTDGFQKLDENASVTVNLEKQTVTVDVDKLSETQARTVLEGRDYKFISMSN
jgi:copper chaperone CopZ